MSLARYVLLHFFLLLSHLVPPNSAHPPCLGFSCGNLGDIGFPLSNTTNPECGLSVMNCTGPQPKVQFHEQGKWYPVNSINYNGRSITIYDQDVQTQLESGRCDSLRNFTVQTSPLLSINVTDTSPLFKCKRENSPISPFNFFDKFSNYTGCRDYDLYFYPDTEKVLPPLPETLYNICSVVHLPRTRIPVSASGLRIDNLTLLWNANFSISWDTSPVCIDCHVEGGLCLSSSNGTFLCGNLPKHGRSLRTKIVLGVVLPAAGIIVVTLILVYLRTKAKNSILPWKKKTATTKHIEAFFKNRGSLAPKQYQYKEVRIMTCSFKKKLGQGGYGSVFKGMLKDGRSVAVKVLCETKGIGEEFINEVESISRTSHVNIVSLLGYCFEGSKRALLYEFMPNGSLEKFIFDEKKPEVNSHLGWETLYQIAVGIARGLEYLHRGCHTRILHFDIKPHNILLDQDFTPKISDFGMAKLCPRKESIVSMLGTRGTVGYIAPEVFSRNFGGVSHKSDVYSYGMMILEITGGTKSVDVEVGHSSDIYFPNWLYKCVELDKDLPIHGCVSEVEKKIRKKMVLVGLWCIQTHPSDRPSMSRALEMLEGSLEVLQIPPKPCFSSPERVSFSSSITLPSSIMDNKV